MSEQKIERAYELTNVDDITEGSTTLESLIWEAYKTALEEDIRANIVMINKRIVKVKEHPFVFMGNGRILPPMICGLKAQLTDELPIEIAFAVVEAPQTERENSFAEGYKEGYRKGYEQGIKDMEKRLNRYYRYLSNKTMTAAVGYTVSLIAQELIEKEVKGGKEKEELR